MATVELATGSGLAGQVSAGTDLPARLQAELAGLAVGDPMRARLRARARVIEWYLPMSVHLAHRFGVVVSRWMTWSRWRRWG
jgi:hypothetical protein